MTRTRLVAAALALALGAPQPALAQAAAPAPALPPAMIDPTPAALAAGREIAELLNLGEILDIQLEKLFTETLPKQLREQPDFQLLEAEYPGVIDHVAAAMRAPTTQLLRARAPQLLDQLSRVYATHLDKAELDELLAFYRSREGRWLVLEVARGWDAGELLKASIEDPEADITAAELGRQSNRAIAPVIAKIPAEYRPAMIRLGLRPMMRKVARINPQVQGIAASWANDMNREDSAAMGEVVLEAVQSFVASADAKKQQTPKVRNTQ